MSSQMQAKGGIILSGVSDENAYKKHLALGMHKCPHVLAKQCENNALQLTNRLRMMIRHVVMKYIVILPGPRKDAGRTGENPSTLAPPNA